MVTNKNSFSCSGLESFDIPQPVNYKSRAESTNIIELILNSRSYQYSNTQQGDSEPEFTD